jgi:photosystem II stability/assembly factor-like uncharacterized protein
MRMARGLCVVIVSWLVGSGVGVGSAQSWAQDPAAAPADSHPLIEKLLKEIDTLSGEVELLRKRLDADFYSDSDPAQRLAAYEQHVKKQEESLFKDLKWQFLGPTNISGRVTDIAAPLPRGKSYTLYVAAASGGVWKTTNEGTTWKPVFEQAASTSIGDVTVAPSDANIVWVGTGEANIFRSSMAGAGVYKSTDAGATWTHMGLAGTHTIARIVIHPANPDLVYVAASGHEWTFNDDRGVYKSADGGKTWEKVLFVNDQTGAIDLVMDPADPNVLYAATWQRIRKRWNDPRNEPHYLGSGVHKSTDGGVTWTEINSGLPEACYRGRIGLDVCRTKPNVVYAFVDNYEPDSSLSGQRDSYGRARQGGIKGAEVYRSDDHGQSWRKVSEANTYKRLSSTYGWVFGQVRVDPNDENTIYVMGVPLYVSRDGGKTITELRGMHGDHHALFIDPDNSQYLVNGNDGGAVVSYDGGQNWRSFTTQIPVVQFFNISYDMDTPFHVYGSVQDHGSYRGTVDLRRGRDRIRPVEFETAPGGEGSSHAIDPTDPNTVYAAGFYGRIFRRDLQAERPVQISRSLTESHPQLRGQWVAPFILSPHNPRVLYHGMNHLFRSWDRGDKFEQISPDLTHNDPKKLGDIPYQTITTISESPFELGWLYVGTDDGRVHLTRDGGKNWVSLENGIVPNRWISRVVASAYQKETVYLAQNGKRNDDFRPYLFKSTDAGATWRNIAADIPSGPINVVREDPLRPDVLYVGTDLGVYVSVDGGEKWQVLSNGLPSTFVSDLIIHPRDEVMVIATHGRGVYVLDVRPIHAYGQKKDEQPADSEASKQSEAKPAAQPEPPADEENEDEEGRGSPG